MGMTQGEFVIGMAAILLAWGIAELVRWSSS